MRLLLLTEYFPPHAGGTAVYYYEICRRLRGIDITVVTRADARASSFDSRQPFRIIRTPFPPIPKVRVIIECWAQFLTALWLILKRGADMVHGGQVFPLGLAVCAIHFLTRVPYALYVHGEEVVVARRRPWRRAAIEFVLRHADAVFVNSWFTASQVLALGVPRGHIHVARPGVNPERFRPLAQSSVRARLGNAGGHVLFSAGRLIPRKGQDTVIRLLPHIAAVIPDVTYWIAGGGSRTERQRLEKLAEAAGVTDRIRFLGEVSDGDLPFLYAACDVFVMLNRMMPDGDVEGFGIVFLEASACGKPVVGGHSGGAIEAVKEGKTGFLIPEGSDSAAVSIIVRLLSDADLRAQMGKAARQRAIRHFSWDRTADRVAQVIAGSRQRSAAAADVALEGRLVR